MSSAANADCREEAEMQKLTICYERLSRDDERAGVSNSIVNQKQILQEYAERNNLIPYRHIFDDGQSGTTFSRPGWVELMSEVEAGNVGTILLKTMDRMGRDYLRVGLLLEQFKDMGVRIIAVSEGVDTANGEDDFLPLRNLFAEWFARDTSKKIRAVFQSRMANGKRCSGAIPYGYLRNNGDTQDLIIDDEAAVVIRRIYAMIIEGRGINYIARTLMAEQIPIPSEHWKRIGMEVRASSLSGEYDWTPTTIGYIISNPVYKGTLVLSKTKNVSYKGRKKIDTTPEEQFVFENAMPVIVEPETWVLAQKLRRTVRKAPKVDKEPNALTGLLYCGACGSKMSRRYTQSKRGYLENSYICSRYRGLTRLCSMHYISVISIENLLLSTIRRVSGYVREHEPEFIEKVREASDLKQVSEVRENKKLIAKYQRRRDELDTLITQLYEDRVAGKIPEKHYDRMIVQYDTEQTGLEPKISELQASVDSYASDSVRTERFIELVKKYTEFEELTPVMLNEFVDRVLVYDPVKINGKRTQRVDVYLNFIGSFDVPEE
jgi:DNA invertase Pin-like site-specific DNA recombinase